MPIFNTRYEKNTIKEQRDMISVPLCRNDVTYLNIYALAKGTSVNAIHRKAVHEWICSKVDKYVMLGEIQATIQRHWYHNKDSYANFKQFQNGVKVELSEAGLPLTLIEGLIKNLKEL